MRYLVIFLVITFAGCLNAAVFTASYEEMLKQTEFVEKMKKVGAKFSDEEKATMRHAKQLIKERTQNPGIKVGQPAPQFELQDAYGKTVSLTETLKTGPVILVFYRGAWCPYCNLHLHALKESLPAFAEYRAQLITITPQMPDKSREQFAEDGAPFEVLSDLDYTVMKAYHLYFELPDELVTLYQKIDLNIEDYNGAGRRGLPVPGTFVIDQQGIVRAMHAESDYSLRMEPAAIVEALSKISAQP